jgi:hypothetical protein
MEKQANFSVTGKITIDTKMVRKEYPRVLLIGKWRVSFETEEAN